MNTQADLDDILHNFAGCGYPHPSYMYCQWCDNLPETKQAVNAYITATFEQVIGKDDRDYSQDNADEESLKILVATSTACNELRAEQRRTLARLTGDTEICTCDCHTRQGAEQDNHCSLC